MAIKALLLTLFVGIFFGIGLFIPRLIKNKNKLIFFTTGLSFVVILYLNLLDLLPEIIELAGANSKNYFVSLLFILIGIIALKGLDLFIPEHHHEHHEHNDNLKEHNSHLFHVGIITAISLILHNVLEGISIYITGLNNLKLGLFMAISVGCHNLPLGIEIAANMESEKKTKTKILINMLLILSSFLGAFILYILNQELNEAIESILLSLTCGMLIYISLFELAPEIKENWQKKEIKIGLIAGLIIAIILFLV